jgi:hypothetical protein
MRFAKDLSPAERRAMATFLSMEKRRHEKDIMQIDADLARLEKLGVYLEGLPDWVFVTTEEPELGFL